MSQARHFVQAVIWLGIVLLMYGIHSDDIPDSNLWEIWSVDKFGHFMLFAILVHLWLTSLNKQTKWKHLKANSVKIVVIAGILLGSILELLQGMIFASRSTEVLDLVANCAGVICGSIFFRIIYADSIYR